MSDKKQSSKMYQLIIPADVTVKDLAEVLKLMTITLEVDAGDPVADDFVKNNPHLVVDITVAHEQAREIGEAFDETAKKNLS